MTEPSDGRRSPVGGYFAARFLAITAMQMQSVAVGWDVYDRTHRALDLGYVGLAQFAPVALLTLVAGSVADRLERKYVLAACYCGLGALAAALYFVPAEAGVGRIYALIVFVGVARAFAAPASQALLPDLVDRSELSRTVARGSSLAQVAMVAGPALGGVLYGAIGRAVYLICAMLVVLAALFIGTMWVRARVRDDRAPSWDTVLAGVRYVWAKKVVLGAVSLDLFAVLLGGAVALLPVFARDLLHVGPWGMGFLRSAPALGAAVTGLSLTRWPLRRRAGHAMFVCVAIFGLATIVFGLSQSFMVSLAALAVVGAADMVSVVVRTTLVQMETPEDMRGRVSAVNSAFVGASNELGEMESGLTAAWLGAVPAVIAGGVGTLVVVAVWSLLFPELRKVEQLDGGSWG